MKTLLPRMLLVVAAVGALIADPGFAQEIDVSKPPCNGDMTGATDGTAALNCAIALATAPGGPRAVYVPAGTLKITATILLTSAVRIFGTNALASTIKWGGANGGTMINVTTQFMGGGGLSNLALDGNNLAANDLLLDGTSTGKYDSLTIIGFTTGDGLKVTGSTNTGSWNVFSNITISSITNGHSCLWISGSVAGLGGGNACHNTFINIKLIHGGTRPALRLGACDNNNLTDIFISQNNGAAAGVLVDPAEVSGFPAANLFFHLQAGGGGWVQPNTTIAAPGWVFGYQQDNGQPAPALNGTPLFYTDDGGNLNAHSIKGTTAIRARVYNSGDISLPNSVETVLTFNSERSDSDSIHSTSSNTSRLTCNTAGTYTIDGGASFDINAGGLRYVAIRLNGSTLLKVLKAPPQTANYTDLSVTTIYDLAANDYVELVAFQNSGGALNLKSFSAYSPEFSMVRNP